jgi:DNA invertase Pin-like site-specific DNA recombinase
LNVALYARVSTLNGQQDPEMRLSELREYAVRRGLRVHEEYVDQGISGSKESRPALNKLMTDADADSMRYWFGKSIGSGAASNTWSTP